MSSALDRAVKHFQQAIQEAGSNKTKPFDTQAEVIRVEDGVAWVHMPGGIDETPVQLTVNAKKGDTVQVRVAGGKAWLVGNGSAPPTDDTRAIEADDKASSAVENANIARMAANQAEEAAAQAVESATEAKETTDEINRYAETAGKTVTQILDDGETAGIAAQEAKTAADKATKDLAQVENVVGVVNWIAEHGTMTSQAGETFDSSKVYFVIDPNGDYHIGSTYYSVVQNPVAEDIDSYYLLSIDESVQNYVMTHLYVDSEGLWIIPNADGNKVLIATGSGSTYETGGTYIFGTVDGVDTVLAQFSENGIQIGRQAPGNDRIRLTSNGLDLIQVVSGSDVVLAHIGQNYHTFGSRLSSEPTGFGSFAAGQNTVAKGTCSYAGGLYTLAGGDYSRASGNRAEANGYCSVSHGFLTISDYDLQIVIGQYNDNQSDNAFEIGNGISDSNRSNALAVCWDGDVEIALDTSATSGVDKEIYDALVKLGWDSDVIV